VVRAPLERDDIMLNYDARPRRKSGSEKAFDSLPALQGALLHQRTAPCID